VRRCLHIELTPATLSSTDFIPGLHMLVGARSIVQSFPVSTAAPPSQPCDAAALMTRDAAKVTYTARKSVCRHRL
jgi:hypothetical protein